MSSQDLPSPHSIRTVDDALYELAGLRCVARHASVAVGSERDSGLDQFAVDIWTLKGSLTNLGADRSERWQLVVTAEFADRPSRVHAGPTVGPLHEGQQVDIAILLGSLETAPTSVALHVQQSVPTG